MGLVAPTRFNLPPGPAPLPWAMRTNFPDGGARTDHPDAYSLDPPLLCLSMQATMRLEPVNPLQ